jgi:hypothetical protein
MLLSPKRTGLMKFEHVLDVLGGVFIAAIAIAFAACWVVAFYYLL